MYHTPLVSCWNFSYKGRRPKHLSWFMDRWADFYLLCDATQAAAWTDAGVHLTRDLSELSPLLRVIFCVEGRHAQTGREDGAVCFTPWRSASYPLSEFQHVSSLLHWHLLVLQDCVIRGSDGVGDTDCWTSICCLRLWCVCVGACFCLRLCMCVCRFVCVQKHGDMCVCECTKSGVFESCSYCNIHRQGWFKSVYRR